MAHWPAFERLIRVRVEQLPKLAVKQASLRTL